MSQDTGKWVKVGDKSAEQRWLYFRRSWATHPIADIQLRCDIYKIGVSTARTSTDAYRERPFRIIALDSFGATTEKNFVSREAAERELRKMKVLVKKKMIRLFD